MQCPFFGLLDDKRPHFDERAIIPSGKSEASAPNESTGGQARNPLNRARSESAQPRTGACNNKKTSGKTMKGIRRFDELVFVDDFFRSADNGLPSHPANRRFLAETFGLQARRLGLTCREEFARSDGGGLDVAAMMAALSLPQDSTGWARAVTADLGPLDGTGLVPPFAPRQLVIGWGMTPSLMHWIDRAGASFMDIEIDPIRFASHLSFCVRTNDRAIEAALGGWRVEDETFWNEAAVLKGYFARRSAPHIFAKGMRVGLFCGQTTIHLALVADGAISQPMDSVDQLGALAASVDLLLIRPHPYEPDLHHLTTLAAQLPNATWTRANFYALLCAQNLEFVCALSSGALREAAYFMKPVVPLIEPDRNNRKRLPAACSDWIAVGPGVASRDALATLCGNGDRAAAVVTHFPDDALDRAFAARWGLDAGTAGLIAGPTLEPATVYRFGIEQPATAWLGFGWSSPEAGGVWTDNERASIVVPLGDDACMWGPMSLRVQGWLVIDQQARAPRVCAWLNGRRTHAQSVGGYTLDPRASFAFDVGTAECSRTGVLRLEFEIFDPVRPRDIHSSPDARRLAFFVEQLQFASVDQAPGRQARDDDHESPAAPPPAPDPHIADAERRCAPQPAMGTAP